MSLIAAVVSVCLTAIPGSCETRTMRVEPKACHIGALRAEAPVGGAWAPVTIRIACEGK